jgi:hypothetical protein
MCPPTGPPPQTELDPGIPDSVTLGNLDGSSVVALVGGVVTIPVWVRSDEPIGSLNIAAATDNIFVAQRLGGTFFAPLSSWDDCSFLSPASNQPSPGLTTQALLGWAFLTDPGNPCLNTGGSFQKIAEFSVEIVMDPGLIGLTTQVTPGLQPPTGYTLFSDSLGRYEWHPPIVNGFLEIDMVSVHRIAMELHEGLRDTTEFIIANAEGGDMPVIITHNEEPEGWLSVTPSNDIIPPYETLTSKVYVNASSLIPGTYSGLITVTTGVAATVIGIPIEFVVIGGCQYIPGDFNGVGGFNGIDVGALVNYFKDWPVPEPTVRCPTCGSLGLNMHLPAGDVNGTCRVDGIDVGYMVNHFKFGDTAFPTLYCPQCPPAGMNPPAPAVEPIRAPMLKGKSKTGVQE